MTSISLVMVLPSKICNRVFVIDHTFSFVLGSGECPGQTNIFTLYFLNLLHFMRQKTLGKILFEYSSTIRNPFPLFEMTFLKITSMYLSEFIIPSIDVSKPTPEKLKLL